ncbi:dimethyl sulfoxide reductase anchor subunit [Lentisphaera marina]|uniref:DmsC/YnfH family molybdoenzyme membrane anchor subunit n=1 Tax=Lentisphaera marina TaxID=1111041 RepID=UPI002365C2F8|nr:DmsC/YnfH family molybdoenzyme membrane anchor subunit [Lentisphaera marina]MDD7984207.1 dimethyl sulfoxide reductase anchor subunit [Lentisphaera marina]
MAVQEKVLVDKKELVKFMLQEQQELTVVSDFAQKHENQEIPLQQEYYESLIPLSKPGEGEQYAFKVNLDACTGCKACVTACHSLNGLDEDETWRSVGLLRGGSTEEAQQQHVTSACHHCLEPACSEGCPVNAYDKDEVTGIVKHLDDQCIGCQYCILKCPYEVPQYNKRMGIVRKCDMCTDRLAVGEAPACVQACPTKAISIQVVNQEEVLAGSMDSTVVPGAPNSEFTQPTTRFESDKPLSKNMLGSDYYSIKPQHSHPPLVGMLVLTQLSVGAFCVDTLFNLLNENALINEMQGFHSIVALALGILALKVSILHLGRPQFAFRAFLGLRTSWLSREILGFSVFAGLATLYAALFWLPQIENIIGIALPEFLKGESLRLQLSLAVAVSGIIGVICSVMVYDDCKKELWRGSITGLKFFGSSIVLGLSTIALASLVGVYFIKPEYATEVAKVYSANLAILIIIASFAKMAWEGAIFRHLKSKTYSMEKRSAMLMTNHLLTATRLRYLAGFVGGVVLPLFLYNMSQEQSIELRQLMHMLWVAGGIFVLTLVGELSERFLFFAAIVSKKMPGDV